ncbi:chromosome segregation protein SMC [Streptomyces alkaliterrae]|uniref:Chromosome partition protein Smc n=1 Tax=Streptomyces alkaliterrae TaxID=2213162 RepID=A0A5P0YZ02_9ACTN|nr:chromosome segregation protein SMC [Streptomyces alkaliterrae]MBB1255640.1 chromosome segregation protein SMC [Streptomyces alkaliterrae]MBB1257265.1 chromosome segregation protein SMC [Streptomyces alkaliterrae]MQS03709.1 chromosome segregation protein SMC [Streptomyces alkaliterrae]
MHLKSLTLRGFKSFASATTLRFEPGITCVVGPNGSGKSNVVDALSWVMGEQGAKSLRGGKMEDVIFAGTTGRPPLGRAEVSLTIDNSDGALPIEYAEVTITRIMFRNGGSEYQINGDTCRLLDIQELLSDSGIGREMHVIVGQGQLDSVLHADPAGRRAFIEEAAGVLKHRKRKEKALRKLDAMQANLARVQDLTEELRRQLKPLGRQAAVARRAAVIQADLRDARLRLLADDLVTVRRALEAELADEAALKARKEAAEEAVRDCRRREAELEQRVRTLAPRLERAQRTWYELSQLAERVRGTVSLAEARVRSATAAPPEERRGRDPEELEREADRVREQEAELEAALEAASRALEDTVEHRSELERRLVEEERRIRDASRALAERREQLARLGAQASAARTRAVSARSEIERLVAAEEEAGERAELAQEEFEALRAEADAVPDGDESAEAEHEAARARLREAEEALAAAREALGDAQRRRAAVSARRDALALGLRRKDGSESLLAAEERPAGLLGRAAERLTVAPGYEVPVAAALGAAADALVAAGPEAAAEALRLLRKTDGGRADFLLAGAPGDQAGPPERPEPPDGSRWAVSLVEAPEELRPALRRLLRDVVVVTTLEEAEELVARRPELTAVTAGGDVLAAFSAHGGSAGVPSLLETQAAVDEAAAELRRLTVRCEELEAGLRSAEERRARAVEAVEEWAARRSAADRRRSELAGRLGRSGGAARAARGEAERCAAAVAKAREALAAADEQAAECAERLAAAEELADEQDEPDTAVRDRLAADGANARQTEMEARLQVRTHEERVRALAGRADSLDRAARAEREARARAERRRARMRHEAGVAEAVANGARQLLAHLEVSLVRAEQEREAAERAKAEREGELAAERERGRELKGELDRLTDSVHRGEVLGAEKRLRIEQLEGRSLEELGVEPEALMREYGPDQPVPPSPPAEGEELPEDPEHPRNRPVPFDRAEQEKRLRAAERAYQKLGKVNPLALEEYAALEERHRFLGEQLDDLRKTRADLLQVVRDVDERVRQVFTDAYHDTAREFEGVFSRLFPGGEGRLVLTQPDDMLATGVDVEARPPGKKVKRLSLLSGGERSLTAVALLVSIFKARPSPFYVMDEVEAALDDTNLQRLIGIMRELQESSQLIVITHQKRTMEVADALYGVSMQGDGVSKVISQRLS